MVTQQPDTAPDHICDMYIVLCTRSHVYIVLRTPAGSVAGGIILLIFGLGSGVVFWFIRDQLRLCGQLLAVAGTGYGSMCGQAYLYLHSVVLSATGSSRYEKCLGQSTVPVPQSSRQRFAPSSGKGLQECPGIIVAAIGIKFAGIGIM